MSRKATILLRQLTNTQTLITAIEANLPGITKIKSYERNFSATKTEYQQFGDVAGKYLKLLEKELDLAESLDSIEGNSGGSYLAEFGSREE